MRSVAGFVPVAEMTAKLPSDSGGVSIPDDYAGRLSVEEGTVVFNGVPMRRPPGPKSRWPPFGKR